MKMGIKGELTHLKHDLMKAVLQQEVLRVDIYGCQMDTMLKIDMHIYVM
jgi:hypothetical protein